MELDISGTLFEIYARYFDNLNPRDVVGWIRFAKFVYQNADKARKQRKGKHFDMSGRPKGKHFKV